MPSIAHGIHVAPPVSSPSDAILDHLPDVVIRYDAADRVLYVNEAFTRVTGATRDAVIGKREQALNLSPETIAEFSAARRQAFTTGQPVTFDVRRPTPAGNRLVQYRIVPEPSRDGRVQTVLAIGRDVTELHEAIVALHESEQQLAALVRQLPGVAYRRRLRDSRIEFMSEGALALTGYPASHFEAGDRWLAVVHPDDRDALIATVERAMDDGDAVKTTYRIVRADGATRWVLQHSRRRTSETGESYAEGLLLDVTEREEARRALEQERMRLTEAQRIARLGAWHLDMTTGLVSVSDDWTSLFGVPVDTPRTLDSLFLSRLLPEDRARYDERRALVLATRPKTTDGRWRIGRPDGSVVVVHMRTEWTYDADGNPTSARGTFQDVTDEVAQQDRLMRQQAMLEESQRLAGVGSWEYDVATQSIEWSSEMYRIAGIEQDDAPLTLDRVRERIHPDDSPLTRAKLAESIATGGSTEYELRMVRPSGEVRIINARTRAITGVDGHVDRVIGSCQDITERRLLEEQVRQSQKMDALGMLAGSVAHDFNNLLSAIIGGAELARLGVDDGSETAQDLDDVRQAATRAAQLTRQLLAFSRKQVRQPRPVDLGDAARGAEKLLRRLLPENVALDLAAGSGPVVAVVDPSQLEQALINLVVNARDAIVASEHGAGRAMAGVITVRAERVTLAEGDPRLVPPRGPALPPGDYATLVVSDTGTGIAPTTLARIFEPFFTTKEPGKGTGIGLATVFEIAVQSGGSVACRTALGAGTTFTILLPAVAGEAEQQEMVVSAPPTGTETILLVEDESVVRETATRILERHGYRVIAARHGGDAMLAWREHAADIQLLATDLRMPELGGHSLVAKLRAERPSLPILIMSGYASGKDPEEEALLKRELFLVKPFTSDSLLHHVRMAIDKTRA